MNRTPVNSSNIRSVGYDPESETLEVQFHSGSVYQYYSVPASIYEKLLSAASKGAFLNDYIKDQFTFKKVH